MADTKIKSRGADAFFYEHFLAEPTSWLRKARELRAVARILAREMEEDHRLAGMAYRDEIPADVLLNRPRVLDQWCMLLAFMLENVIKGLRIAQDPTLKNGERLHKLLLQDAHDLGAQAKAAGVTTTADEDAILEYLSDAAVSSGRYPCSAKAANQHGERSAYPDEIGTIAEALYLRIGEMLLRTDAKKFPPETTYGAGSLDAYVLQQLHAT